MYNNLKNKYAILLHKPIGSTGSFGEFLPTDTSSCLGNTVCNH